MCIRDRVIILYLDEFRDKLVKMEYGDREQNKELYAAYDDFSITYLIYDTMIEVARSCLENGR